MAAPFTKGQAPYTMSLEQNTNELADPVKGVRLQAFKEEGMSDVIVFSGRSALFMTLSYSGRG